MADDGGWKKRWRWRWIFVIVNDKDRIFDVMNIHICIGIQETRESGEKKESTANNSIKGLMMMKTD